MTNLVPKVSELFRFSAKSLSEDHVRILGQMARQARIDILKMCAQAGSGHPGGSMSSVDIYLLLWLCADINPRNSDCKNKDHVIVSHGHTAAGVYAALAQVDLIDRQAVIEGFRKMGSPFEGHINPKLPGIEWCSGNLGQGLSVGCGMAIANRISNENDSRVFVVMGDGEQQKGQIAEARHLASKYNLNRLIAVIDFNELQAMGRICDIMPQDLAAEYMSSEWNVIQTDGHDFALLYDALRGAYNCDNDKPTVILAKTVMGKGVSFMENHYEYHGQILKGEKLCVAIKELGMDAEAAKNKKEIIFEKNKDRTPVECSVSPGQPRLYKKDDELDCRSAFGNALLDIAKINIEKVPIAVVDCDLSTSVKTAEFAERYPDNFIQTGISEHAAASIAGGISKTGVLTFFADFAVFGFYEALNQQRQNDINETSVKYVFTHCGLDVGEDGKTHQCVDYIGIAATLYNTKLLIPADPNQADRMVRYAATTPGNIILAMGRSKVPVLSNKDGGVFFDSFYEFEYGISDWLRQGKNATIITCGTMTSKAVEASEKLFAEGISVGVLNCCCPLEVDKEALSEAAKAGFIITYEDHNLHTGLGDIVACFLAENITNYRLVRMGLNGYGGSGRPADLYKKNGLDVACLTTKIKHNIK